MKKKIRATSGETIVETLVTMVILSLAVLMLAGAAVSSAKINSREDNTDTAFTTDEQSRTEGSISVSVDGESDKTATLDIHRYHTENGYTYYEP